VCMTVSIGRGGVLSWCTVLQNSSCDGDRSVTVQFVTRRYKQTTDRLKPSNYYTYRQVVKLKTLYLLTDCHVCTVFLSTNSDYFPAKS
jgi:hypothetical protein